VTLLAARVRDDGRVAGLGARAARAPSRDPRRLRDESAAGEDGYLDAVVKEVLRTRPVLSIAARKLAAPFAVGGWQLPAGVHVAPCIYLTHRRPELYREPLAFCPERSRRRRLSPTRGSHSAAGSGAAWAPFSPSWR
jgi:cytochrome P450 family 135